jgi:hypothetical protein
MEKYFSFETQIILRCTSAAEALSGTALALSDVLEKKKMRIEGGC